MSPRWEWRTLSERSDDAERRFETYPPTTVAESDEQYLLSLDREVSAKIRDGLMDVKVLEHRRDDGLEQWRPIMKAEMRVTSVWKARTIRSHIRRMWAVRSAGTPAGRVTSSGISSGVSFSARWMRSSISRTPDRY